MCGMFHPTQPFAIFSFPVIKIPRKILPLTVNNTHFFPQHLVITCLFFSAELGSNLDQECAAVLKKFSCLIFT